MVMVRLTADKVQPHTQGTPDATAGEGRMSKGCKAYAVELSAYFDGELRGDALARMESHLAACENCRDTLARLRKLRNAMHALSKPPRRRSSILEDLKARMQQEGDLDDPEDEPQLPC